MVKDRRAYIIEDEKMIRSVVNKEEFCICLTCSYPHYMVNTPEDELKDMIVSENIERLHPKKVLQYLLDSNYLDLAEALVNLMEAKPDLIKQIEAKG